MNLSQQFQLQANETYDNLPCQLNNNITAKFLRYNRAWHSLSRDVIDPTWVTHLLPWLGLTGRPVVSTAGCLGFPGGWDNDTRQGWARCSLLVNKDASHYRHHPRRKPTCESCRLDGGPPAGAVGPPACRWLLLGIFARLLGNFRR